MNTEHQASIDHLREELCAMIMAQMEDLQNQIDQLRKEMQMLKERNERLESMACRQ
jgi:peptidoglycan hydrolase CwlO-like protein